MYRRAARRIDGKRDGCHPLHPEGTLQRFADSLEGQAAAQRPHLLGLPLQEDGCEAGDPPGLHQVLHDDLGLRHPRMRPGRAVVPVAHQDRAALQKRRVIDDLARQWVGGGVKGRRSVRR